MISSVLWKEKFLHRKFKFLSSGKMLSIRVRSSVEELV
jgi:hypothetical protein